MRGGFCILFMDRADEQNDGYDLMLKERIIVGCEDGRHPFEGYPLSKS
jgi:hypothetical protein